MNVVMIDVGHLVVMRDDLDTNSETAAMLLEHAALRASPESVIGVDDAALLVRHETHGLEGGEEVGSIQLHVHAHHPAIYRA
jgi:hypothetical protein